VPDLLARGQDNAAEVARRMATAREEIGHWTEFDHVLVNREFEATVAALRAILAATATRRERQPGLADFVAQLLAG
jgi:guanylate kinase